MVDGVVRRSNNSSLSPMNKKRSYGPAAPKPKQRNRCAFVIVVAVVVVVVVTVLYLASPRFFEKPGSLFNKSAHSKDKGTTKKSGVVKEVVAVDKSVKGSKKNRGVTPPVTDAQDVATSVDEEVATEVDSETASVTTEKVASETASATTKEADKKQDATTHDTEEEDAATSDSDAGEVATEVESDPAPTTTKEATKTPVKESPAAETETKPSSEKTRLYSKLSVIPPDPIHPLVTTTVQKALADKWGKWKFWDGEEDVRPDEDYCAAYPNRDIPGANFPERAWQTDAVYVNHYLDAADQLINRAKEAIFTEYGRGKPLPEEELEKRSQMFHWETIDLSTQTEPPDQFQKKGTRGIGGWTTTRSQDGLVRRLLHAMMTSDTFTVVLGGESSGGGKGNHFRQSYTMQFHKIMAPIFARVGVKLVTRNMAQGGVGTVHSSMGSGSIYGNDVDLLIWDSGTDEKQNPELVDLFFRQGLIGGNRVPVLWGGLFSLLRMLHEEADADVGEFGNGLDGIIEVTSAEQAEKTAWAARYLKCSNAISSTCDDAPRFCAHCWIDRDDGVKPEAKQKMTGQFKWHPGWRKHQLVSRVLAFAMLDALQSAIVLWGDRTMSGQPLDDSFWHVTDYYENIRNKVRNLNKDLGDCYKIEGSLPPRMCNTPMKARTQYTPRANYSETSLASIIKPTSDGYVPHNDKVALYEGPDAHNTCYDLPADAIDIQAIISGRRRLEALDEGLTKVASKPTLPGNTDSNTLQLTLQSRVVRRLASKITPGKGWQLVGEPQGLCDGTYTAVCGRSTDNECVLSGHPDGRGAILGNELSGWLVMELKDVLAGIIVLKLQTWHDESELTRTGGSASVNSSRRLGQSKSSPNSGANTSERELKTKSSDTPPLPDKFVFEYAIDGVITSLDRDAFLEKKKSIQRLVETITLLDDPKYTKEKARDIEVAVRLRGCGRQCTFGISHIYWA